MSVPVDAVAICNLALTLLKSDHKVASIEDPLTDTEELCALWYDLTRRAVLRMFPWNFARRRSTVNRSGTPDESDYSDEYSLPNDYLGMIFVGQDIDDDYITDFFVEENRKLLLNNSGAESQRVCYIFDVEDVRKFDPIFTNFLIGELATVIGNSISGLNKSTKKVQEFRDRWEAKARSKNAQENPPRKRYSSPILGKRRKVIRRPYTDGQHLF